MSLKKYLSSIAGLGAVSETALYTPLATDVLGGPLNYAAKYYAINKSGAKGTPDIRLFSGEDNSEWIVCEVKLDDDEHGVRVDAPVENCTVDRVEIERTRDIGPSQDAETHVRAEPVREVLRAAQLGHAIVPGAGTIVVGPGNVSQTDERRAEHEQRYRPAKRFHGCAPRHAAPSADPESVGYSAGSKYVGSTGEHWHCSETRL